MSYTAIRIGERVMAYQEGRRARLLGAPRSAPWLFGSSAVLCEIWLAGWDEAYRAHGGRTR